MLVKRKNISYGLAVFIGQHVKGPQDVLHRASFFVKMYDELYHDLALKKIFVQKRVLRIVESLALPPEQQSDKKLTSLCQKIHIMKQDIKKEMIKK